MTTPPRKLTPLESAHVQSKLRSQRWGRRATMGASLALAVVGVGMYAALIAEGRTDTDLILIMMAAGALAVVGGLWIFVVSWRRRFHADDHVTELTGPLVERVVHVTNPRSGVRQTVRTYHVEDTLLLLPFETESLCARLVGQPVRVVAALIHKSNPVQLLGSGSPLNERGSEAVLLELDDHIHVDHVLSTYGRHYFRRRMIRQAVVLGLTSCATLVPLVGWILNGSHDNEDPISGGWAQIGLAIAGFVVVGMLLEWLYDRVERRLAPLSDDLSHEERLRKPA